MMKWRRKGLACVAAMVAVVGMVEADARGKVRMRGGLHGGNGATGPVLSRDELRVCLGHQEQLAADSDALKKTGDALSSHLRALETLEADISQREVLVDRRNPAAVDEFNRMIDKHRQSVADYNGKLPAYRAQVEAYKVVEQVFNERCAGHSYYVDDMQAVRSGR